MSSAVCFNLDQSKGLSSANGLMRMNICSSKPTDFHNSFYSEANVRQLSMLEIIDSPCSGLNQTMAASLIQKIGK